MPPRSRGLGIFSLPRYIARPTVSRCTPVLHTHLPPWPSVWSYKLRLERQANRHVFSTSSTRLKKAGKGGRATSDTPIPDNKAQRNRDAEVDPYDYSALQAGIDSAIAKLKDALRKTRHAGRISSEIIEDLRVELSKGGKKIRLGDIATVVPRGGRTMQVFCGEREQVRAITTSIQSSPFSLTPTADEENPLLLTFQVPPATAETRQQAAEEAKRMKERADLDVRTARGDAQKMFNKWEKEKAVIRDELHKARLGMEKVVKLGTEEVQRTYETALKTLER